MRVLLVDDQADVIRGLKHGINWPGLGFSDVECACSAKAAREILLQRPVDLIVSDIEMPEESGLELLEWLRGCGSRIACVFLTAYPEFRYAQEAIRLGGFDYLLQPVDYRELERVIRKAMARVTEDQGMIDYHAQVEKLWFDIAMGIAPTDDTAFRQYLSRSGIPPSNWFTLCYIHIIRRRYTVDEWTQQDTASTFKDWLREHMAVSPIEIIAMSPSRYLIVTAWDSPETMASIWAQWVKVLDATEAERCIIACYIGESCTLDGITATALALQQMDSSNVSNASGIFLLSRDESRRARLDCNEDDGVILKVQDHISETLHLAIPREELAQAVHLSPQYLSRLFKKHTGKPLQEYIQDERIFKAKRMLQFSHDSISAIAEACGFSSASYFANVFKQRTGMTPAEFRAQNQG